MSQLRNLNATDRALLADRWAQHQRTCKQCAMFNPSRPATLAYVCVQGAPVIKEHLHAVAEHDRTNKRKRDLRKFKRGFQGLPGVPA